MPGHHVKETRLATVSLGHGRRDSLLGVVLGGALGCPEEGGNVALPLRLARLGVRRRPVLRCLRGYDSVP